MAFRTECVHCHEAITDSESQLLIGEAPYHRNCGLSRLIGPIENDLGGKTTRQEADATIAAWEKKRDQGRM